MAKSGIDRWIKSTLLQMSGDGARVTTARLDSNTCDGVLAQPCQGRAAARIIIGLRHSRQPSMAMSRWPFPVPTLPCDCEAHVPATSGGHPHDTRLSDRFRCYGLIVTAASFQAASEIAARRHRDSTSYFPRSD